MLYSKFLLITKFVYSNVRSSVISPGEGNDNPLQYFLAWETPWTKEPGGLQSMGLQRVGHNWTTEHVHMWKSCMLKEKRKHGTKEKCTITSLCLKNVNAIKYFYISDNIFDSYRWKDFTF